MYILPGAFFLIIILVIAWGFDLILINQGGVDIFNSIIFILMSFILGNFFQTISHGRPEKRLKEKFWKGLYPSQIMFFPNNQVINESMRHKFINYCLEHTMLCQEDIEKSISVEQYDHEILEKVTVVFDILRVSFENTSFGSRISTAESHYLFFRGMFVSAFWAGILSLITVIYASVSPLFSDCGISVPINIIENRIPALIVTLVFSVILWRTFRWRCRGAAQGFAREVVRATLSNTYHLGGKSDD